MTTRIYAGDCRDVLKTLPDASVHCVVTSPPYYGLRDYGTAQWDGGDAGCDHTGIRRGHGDEKQATSQGTSRDHVSRECRLCGARRVDRQLGLEATPDAYLQAMVEVFREVRRVLRPDGTLWLNIGDSMSSGGNGPGSGKQLTNVGANMPAKRTEGLAAKQLLMMPARLALALQADGWWVRSDIIWAKPNPMPESVRDRPTSAYEHVYLLTRSARYYYDADAVREPISPNNDGQLRVPLMDGYNGQRMANGPAQAIRSYDTIKGANARNFWLIPTEAFSAAHFATFPTELASRCIKAGTKPGDTVLDPFAGAGTTLLVADRLQRDAIGIDLNADYTRMAMDRCRADAPLLTHIADAADDAYDRPMRDLFQEAAD